MGVSCLRLFEHKVLPEPDNVNKQYIPKISKQFHALMQQNTNIHINIGSAIRQKMSEQGTTIAWLARQIDYDRSNLGKLLQNEHIYPELLLKISVALKSNFFELYAQQFHQSLENKQ